MTVLKELMAANASFCAAPPVDYSKEDVCASKLPRRQLAVITCMDTRLVDFLEPALGIRRGEAKIIKSAGNGVTGVFDGTIRSLLVCIFELGVREIVVIGHHECGMAKTTSAGLIEKMLACGIAPEAVHMIRSDLEHWCDEFHHPEQNVLDTVEQIRMNPLIPKDIPVHGLMFHPRTGRIDLVVDGYKHV